MRQVFITGAVILLLAACKVEKTGPNTYKVVTPQVTTSKTTTAKTEVRQEAKQVGTKIEQGVAKAAEKTGAALQKFGEKTKQKAAGH